MGASASRIGALTTGQANTGLKNANTTALRSALNKYIKAVNELPNKTNVSIRSLMNNKPEGSIKAYRNLVANGVANAVAASKHAKVAVAAANVGAVNESAAAKQVNNAARQINNLKKVEGSIPLSRGLGGALFGVKRGNNQNNSGKNVNRNYVLAILKNNAKYPNNHSKINAIVAYNPGLNFSKLARNNNNSKIKNLLAQANSIKKFKQGPAQHTGYNLGNNNQTGNLFKNFKPANSNINENNKKFGYKLIENTNGNYMKVKRNSNNSTNWSRANNKVYTKKNGGGFNVKTTNNLSSHPINNNNLT
jgi:hypothetical protein